MSARKYEPGYKIKNLTIIKRIYNKNTRRIYFQCECSFGKTHTVSVSNLSKKFNCSCSHKRSEFLQPGDRFNKLVLDSFIRMEGEGRRKKWIWLCVCDCGGKKEVATSYLFAKRVKSCGCLQSEHGKQSIKVIHNNHEYVSDFDTVVSTCANRILQNAPRRKIEITLTKDEIISLIKQPCVYCGSFSETALKIWRGLVKVNVVGIDRVDSSLGYVQGNCVPCCKWCNFAKNNRSTDDFKQWVQTVYNHMFNPISQTG